MNQFIIIHYHEIALKGGNRIYFEKKLVENIKKALINDKYEKIERLWGRIKIKLNEKSDFKKIKANLMCVFGIANFFEAREINSEFENLKIEANNIFQNKYNKKKFKTFKVQTRRTNKLYKLKSPEINKKIGEYLLNKNLEYKLKVDLKKPEYTLFLDIIDNNKALIYSAKIKGLGGLPAGTSGKVLSLISSGFDSPIASYQIMKRGANILFIHFHSYPQTNKASINNVKKIVKNLDKYQYGSTLYLIPFLNIQKEIHLKCNEAYKVIIYRRLMIRIAEKIAYREKAKALVTGESLGQVASQTIDNIQVINEVASLPILRPLIGTDKEEIINSARKIGTFDISSQPYEDCCSLFVPRHPETRAKLKDVLKEEEKINVTGIINEAINDIEKIELMSSDI